MGAHFLIDMAELKKPTTYTEQVELLQTKGMNISDPEACGSFLNNVNYYRLSGYYLPFIDRKTNTFHDNVTFEKVAAIYGFDAKLRNILFLSIEQIEIYLRAKLCYYNAHTYGSDGYLQSENYNSRHDHDKFMDHVNGIIADNGHSPVIKHHIDKYDATLPIWAIIEFFSMGELSHFYRGMKSKDKLNIANELYGIRYDVLESWMRCLTDLRNRCAHYARIYYWLFPAIPKMPDDEDYVPTRRAFAQIYMLKLMYPRRDDWNIDIFTPLQKLIEDNGDYIDLKHIGFPDDWDEMLKY